MNLRGLISVCCVLFTFALLHSGCSQEQNRDISTHQAAGIGLSESSLHFDNQVLIYLDERDIHSENRFLHTVNWELRQPRDFSVSTVTTSAKSGALYVDIFYSCGTFNANARVVPQSNQIEDQVELTCQNVLNARMEAVTEDTIAVYQFEIDIPFLNSLSE